MKQTAVEFLLENIEILIKQGNTFNYPIFKYYFIEEAKEMEKEQQDKFAVDFTEWLNEIKISDNQVYYNNTLGELLVNFKNK